MDAPTAGIVISSIAGGVGLILKYVPARNGGNGNGYKAALAEHNANCNVKGVVASHEVVIAVITNKLENIETGIKEIKDIIK